MLISKLSHTIFATVDFNLDIGTSPSLRLSKKLRQRLWTAEMSYPIHTTDGQSYTFFSLEELDNQIAKVWQQIHDLDAREPWNVVLREQLSQELTLLQGQYSAAKQRADGSAQRDSLSYSSPRKRQMLRFL